MQQVKQSIRMHNVLLATAFVLSLVLESWAIYLLSAVVIFLSIFGTEEESKAKCLSKSRIYVVAFSLTTLPSILFCYDVERAIAGIAVVLGAYLLSLCIAKLKGDFVDMFCDIAFVIVVFGIVCSIFERGAETVITMGRLSPVIRYPNAFGIFVLTAWILSQNDSTHKRFVSRQIAFGAAIVLSFSRGTWLIGCLAVTAVILLSDANRVKRIACTAIGVIVGVVASILPAYDNLFARAQSIGVDVSEWQERLFYYHDAVLFLKDHPFGVGAGNAFLFQGEYQTALYYDVPLLHNGLLQYAVDFGIIPALLFLSIFIRYLLQIAVGRKITYANIACICLFLHGLIDFDWQYPGILALLYFLYYENDEVARVSIPEFKPKVKLWAKRCFTLCGCLMACVSLYTGIAYAMNNMNHPEITLKMLPDSIEAVKAIDGDAFDDAYVSMIEDAATRVSYEDEVLIYKLESCYQARGDNGKAYEMAERMVKKRPLFVNCYVTYARLGLPYAEELVEKGKESEAANVLSGVLDIRNQIEYQKTRLSPKANRLKHKPELYMNEELIVYETEAKGLLESIKTE